jgi:AcrR family transcriptional regulator
MLPEDPAATLGPPAARLLAAAKGIAKRRGLGSLTFERVAQASGQSRTSVTYYFGDKDGLLRALAGSAAWECAKAYEGAFVAAPLVSRLGLVFELLPTALRDEGVRKRLWSAQEWYRQTVSGDVQRLMDRPDEDSRSMASMSLAAIDGLAIQTLVDPGFDPRPSLSLLSELTPLTA